VAALYNPAPEPPPAAAAAPPASGPGNAPPPRRRMPARYVAGRFSRAGLGLLLRRQAAQVGMGRADSWIALSDGGSGLEEFARTNFARPDLVVILDFYHPPGYPERLAAALGRSAEGPRQALAGRWCHKLKHQGGQAMPEGLLGLPPPQGSAARAALREAVTSFTNQAHRMD
jgi:hypothetical protein